MKSICLGCGKIFCYDNPKGISRLLVLYVDVPPQILQSHINLVLGLSLYISGLSAIFCRKDALLFRLSQKRRHWIGY